MHVLVAVDKFKAPSSPERSPPPSLAASLQPVCHRQRFLSPMAVTAARCRPGSRVPARAPHGSRCRRPRHRHHLLRAHRGRGGGQHLRSGDPAQPSTGSHDRWELRLRRGGSSCRGSRRAAHRARVGWLGQHRWRRRDARRTRCPLRRPRRPRHHPHWWDARISVPARRRWPHRPDRHRPHRRH